MVLEVQPQPAGRPPVVTRIRHICGTIHKFDQPVESDPTLAADTAKEFSSEPISLGGRSDSCPPAPFRLGREVSSSQSKQSGYLDELQSD